MDQHTLPTPTGQRPRVVLVGNYPPRRCGIATFTYDLHHSVADIIGQERCRVVATSNAPGGYNYPQEVTFEIQQDRVQDYHRAAEYINFSSANLVCLQHEFGIFGGRAGSYLLSLIDNIKKPLVTTLHSVIKNPAPEYREVMREIVDRSQALVVMSQTGATILQEVYGAPHEKIALIHHGVPDVHFVDSNYYKDRLGFEGRLVILTFGLLSPGKGIEVMLDALPPVVERHPDLAYIVLGATHPEITKTQGERYRLSLEGKVRDLSLESNVIFLNRFVDIAELCEFICASDIYVTPYLSQEQIVSGTLAYAVGAGKAIISTPYWYAQEMLSDGRGVLVGFKNSAELSQALLHLIENPVDRHRMRKKAYEFGRKMVWKEVGTRYVELFEQVAESPVAVHMRGSLRQRMFPQATLPETKLDHLRLLTDELSIIQHAPYGIPDRSHGYSTDDASRALVVLLRLQQQEGDSEDTGRLINTYLSFLRHAQTADGHFHNFMSYDRRFLDEHGSQDTLGRAIWGLGTAVCFGASEGIQALGQTMIEAAEAHIECLSAPRAQAYAICGLHAVLDRYAGASRCRRLLQKLAEELVALYEQNCAAGWQWFEPIVAYGNAKMSEALLLAYQTTGEEAFRQVGLSTLDFLTEIQLNGRFFDLVGNNGWFPRGGEKAIYGQQPIDAGYLVEAYVAAHRVTGQSRYLELAQLAFEWFLGRNRCEMPLYDFRTGACADGLDPQRVSQNQGAEAIICFLLALLALSQIKAQQTKDRLFAVKPLEIER